MRQLVALLFLALTGCATSRSGPGPNAEAELRATERAWLHAYDTHDVEAMASIVAAEFEIVYGNGSVVDKATTISWLTPGEPDDPATRQYTENTHVRLYGSVAILTGIYVSESPQGTNRSRYTDTWIWRDGRWQVVASHLTRLPDEE
ncbi:MAG: nuclear transport factor 2 family protein [Bacteroidota bacterium]